MTDIRVTVLIAAWRASNTIARAVQSALNQTEQNIEVIVIDDCCPEGSGEIARAAAGGDARVKILRNPVNSGPGVARNRGLEDARGEWIAVLDADDVMEPERLERLAAFGDREQLALAADDLLIVTEEDWREPGRRMLGRPCGSGPMFIDLPGFVKGNRLRSGRRTLGHLQPLMRTAFLRKHGLAYDPSTRIGEDYLLMVEVLAFGGRFGVIPDALYRYVQQPGSLSRQLTAADARAMLEASEQFRQRHLGRLDDEALKAINDRRRELAELEVYLTATKLLKGGALFDGVAAFAQRPTAIRRLADTLRHHMGRLRTAASAQLLALLPVIG